MTDCTILINGEARPLGGARTLGQLFAALGVSAEHRAVELNGEIISAAMLGQAPVAPGDQIEVIQFVGGG